MHRTLIVILALAVQAFSQDLSKLPEWARPHAQAAATEPVPAGDPDAWVLFDRTEVAYGGDNEIWTHRYRLVKVLGERGISEGTFMLSGVGGRSNKVKKLKGWNLRPDGELVKLDQDTVVTIEDAGSADFSRKTLTGAALGRVTKGSLVAFESVQVAKLPYGPIDDAWVMESHPVRLWELEAGMRTGWFVRVVPVEFKIDTFHFLPFLPNAQVTPTSVRVTSVPPYPKNEDAYPNPINLFPTVLVRFFDHQGIAEPVWASWDRPATWFEKTYRGKMSEVGALPKGAKDLASLQAIWSWMGHELTYKQVYLTPDRGWVPEASAEVFRKRYGDCKDLATFFLTEAKALGYPGYPTLARIMEGRIESTDIPKNPFNHVIAALKLDASLGLPAEVDTPKGRFLLVDATDPFTPLGRLNDAHRGGQVMICLPDGAQWVKIPDTAILPEQMEVLVEGKADAAGILDATLTYRETSNAWGLRSTARRGGKAALREALLSRYLDLPPTGTFEVLTFGDPLTLDRPFEVKVSLRHPQGLRNQGGEITLVNLGMRIVPGVIQKPGVPRTLPIEKRIHEKLVYRAKIEVPYPVAPVLADLKAENVFRTFVWKAFTKPAGTGTLVEVALDHQSLPVQFGHPDQERGVQEWKKDRTLARNLVADGLAFKLVQ
jgi:hypothetical protein